MRLILGLATLSLACSTTALVAQTGQKSGPPRNQSSRPATSVSRTQDVGANAASEKPGDEQPAPDGPAGKATIELRNEHLNQDEQEMDPVLVDLLIQWSNASAKFERLEGEHLRLEYDSTFEIERQAEGSFIYEQPDKGRIEIEPVPITEKLLASRRKEVSDAAAQKRRSQIRLRGDGQPFELQPCERELWCSDGQRVYSIDTEKKEAQVQGIPADLQGANIMDSPLPFLFGMPPEKAKRRFRMSFSKPFDHRTGFAYLEVLPRLPQDAREWVKANVILDLKTFLPTAVQMLDPTEKKLTVYKFMNLKVNKNATFARFLGKDPRLMFTPDLRGYAVHNIDAEGAVQIADNGQPRGENRTALAPPREEPIEGPAGVANVSGLPYAEAVQQLERQGFVRKAAKDPANTIILKQGPPAADGAIPGTVKSQKPEPGSPLKPDARVELVIWDKATAKQ